MMMDARHNLHTLKLGAKAKNPAPSQALNLLAEWIEKKIPLIYTQQPHNLQENEIRLALPDFNPLTQEKSKAAFIFDKSDIEKIELLPKISTLFPEIKEEHIYVYGSFCWEYLTGKKYTHKNSDLDLLISYNNHSIFNLRKDLLNLHERTGVNKIDGEIRFKVYGDCMIHEIIHSFSEKILFKSSHLLKMISRKALYETYPELTHNT